MSTNPPRKPPLTPVAVWVMVCTLLNAAGWILSALGQLNLLGYSVVLALSSAASVCWWRRAQPQFRTGLRARRFRRGLPLAFAVLAGLAILGGVLHGPSNYDGLAYRVPRVLHWLAEGRWHWIDTEFQRLNTRACGFEWLMTPLIVFTQTDRLFFLLNSASFLLLPGLCFSVLTRLGVRKRAAAAWMWLLPTCYCFLLQAGSISNDLYGGVCAIAALHFALRARKTPGGADAYLAVLAAALMTGSKTSNLPLMLPWLIAFLPALKTLLRRPLLTAGVVALALLGSFVPTAALNWKHCGDWTGLKAEPAAFASGRTEIYVANNLVLLTLQNFAPPIFPFVKQWNATAARLIPKHFGEELERTFEPGGAHWRLGELQVEESAGAGFGVSVLLVASFVGAWFMRRSARRVSAGDRPIWNRAVIAGAGIALAVFMAKSGLSTAARLAAPYYFILLPALLLSPAHSKLVRTRWWRSAAATVILLAALLLVISPARPLWPARTVLAQASDPAAQHPLLQRARTVYEVYGERSDGFAPARNLLPPDLKVLGMVTFDDPETSLWRPFGTRRIRHVTARDTAADLHAAGVEYVLVSDEKFHTFFKRDFNDWLRELNAHVEKTFPLNLRAGTGPMDWHLVRIDPPKQ